MRATIFQAEQISPLVIYMRRIHIFVLAEVLLLTLFGLLMIYEASSFSAFRDFADKLHYIKDQSRWAILGFAGLSFFYFFDYRRLYYFALPLLIVSLILLVLVFIPGAGVFALGARRWINMGFFILQPAEFIKLAMAIYLAAWFSTKEKGRLPPFLLLMGLILGLIMLEPDMGTAIIILSEALFVYYLSGGNIMHFVMLFPALFLGGFLLIKLEPYRAQRLAAFFNSGNLENSTYHVKQILIALGMGGFSGVGLGNSLQKYAYLPETTTDSIFAIIAEEFGFVGSVFLISFFIALAWCGFYIASHARDTFGKLLGGGIITFLTIQTVINLGAQTALLPLTGVPLPFISYGGSSLVVDLCSIGILLNIAKQSNYTDNSINKRVKSRK